MAKNQLIVKKGRSFRDITEILKNEGDRAKLQAYIDEVIRCKQKILDENESIKALRDSAVTDLGVEPKMFNSLVSLFFNNNFDEKRAEIEMLEAAIDVLTRNVLERPEKAEPDALPQVDLEDEE